MAAALELVVGELESYTDGDLVEEIRAGHDAAYRVLVQRYQRRVTAVIVGMVRNQEDATELAQEAFIKAYRNLHRFESRSSFYTWLYRIAVNGAIDFKRREAKRRHTEFEDSRIQNDDAAAPHAGHSAMAPDKAVERGQLGQHIMDAIEQLPDDQRTAIVLRELEGLSYKEIADVLECPEGTVMSRLYYGRRKLQALLRGLRP